MKNLKGNVFFKIAIILVLILLLLIPTFMVQQLIHEREGVRQSAIREVSSKWANGQTIAGPYITVPYDRIFRTYNKETEKTDVTRTRNYAYFLPEELKINGEIIPEKRYRGIYEVVVYESKLGLKGRFNPLTFEQIDAEAEKEIFWDKATLNLGISDLRGIEKQISLKWNDAEILFNPGTGTKDIVNSGINAEIDVSDNEQTSYAFDMKIDLKGSQHLYFTPVGKTTDVVMTSNWNTPSFTGNFLPDEREISEAGFTANWNVLHLNRNYPQVWKANTHGVRGSEFGTNLLLPVDNYKKAYRVARYAVLFITLTFMVFFFVEVLNKVFIHPIQYLLVGVALVVFFSLLLAFSEHMIFNLAYVVAALLTLILVTAYTTTILKSRQLGLLICGILLVLYGFIFTIIQLEDYALLIGSIGVFVILAIVMYFSRKIDWYNIRIGDS